MESKDLNIIYLKNFIKNDEKLVPSGSYFNSKSWQQSISLLKRRSLAFVIDLVFISFVNTIIHQGYGLFMQEILYPISHRGKAELISGSPLLFFGVFVFLFTSYFFYSGVVWNGKSIGKQLLKISIVSDAFFKNKSINDYSPSVESFTVRALGYTLCYLSCGMFFLFNFSSEDNRGLVEMMSGSRSVSDEWLAEEIDKRQSTGDVITIDIEQLSIQNNSLYQDVA